MSNDPLKYVSKELLELLKYVLKGYNEGKISDDEMDNLSEALSQGNCREVMRILRDYVNSQEEKLQQHRRLPYSKEELEEELARYYSEKLLGAVSFSIKVIGSACGDESIHSKKYH